MPKSEVLRPGSFDWCVETLSIQDNPAFTEVGKVVCREWTAWPEQLLGRQRAGAAVSNANSPPLASGLAFEPSVKSHVVAARRFAWHLGHMLTGCSAKEAGEAFGGHSPSTVKPWLVTMERFEKEYHYWKKETPTDRMMRLLRQIDFSVLDQPIDFLDRL